MLDVLPPFDAIHIGRAVKALPINSATLSVESMAQAMVSLATATTFMFFAGGRLIPLDALHLNNMLLFFDDEFLDSLPIVEALEAAWAANHLTQPRARACRMFVEVGLSLLDLQQWLACMDSGQSIRMWLDILPLWVTSPPVPMRVSRRNSIR